MRVTADRRTVILGEYIAETGATVRAAAKKFNISKSTVHKDVSERLRSVDPSLYKEVKKVLESNKSQRHIRGGQATRRKYLQLRNQKVQLTKNENSGPITFPCERNR